MVGTSFFNLLKISFCKGQMFLLAVLCVIAKLFFDQRFLVLEVDTLSLKHQLVFSIQEILSFLHSILQDDEHIGGARKEILSSDNITKVFVGEDAGCCCVGVARFFEKRFQFLESLFEEQCFLGVLVLAIDLWPTIVLARIALAAFAALNGSIGTTCFLSRPLWC